MNIGFTLIKAIFFTNFNMGSTCEIQIVQDKERGTLVLSIKPKNNLKEVLFFKFQDQVIERHPEQVQNLVRKCKPTNRVKKIDVDISEFLFVYYNCVTNKFEFKGCELRSTTVQAEEVHSRKINKEIGILKRKITIEDRKQEKIAAKERILMERIRDNEKQFQIERAQRITELMKEKGTKRVTELITKRNAGQSSGGNQMDAESDDDEL